MAVTEKFDRYSVDEDDGYLAVGGRPSPVRFDPRGYEDCAADYEPCACHGDRLCRLGQLMRWAGTSYDHYAWLSGMRETPQGADLLRMAGCKDEWELKYKIRSAERNVRDLWREGWPLLMVCADEERTHAFEVAMSR